VIINTNLESLLDFMDRNAFFQGVEIFSNIQSFLRKIKSLNGLKSWKKAISTKRFLKSFVWPDITKNAWKNPIPCKNRNVFDLKSSKHERKVMQEC